MNYLPYEFDLGSSDVVEVILDKQANVRLLDPANYSLYRSGTQYNYYGGLAKESPVRIPTPHAGDWRPVVDLGGYGRTVRATAYVLQGAA